MVSRLFVSLRRLYRFLRLPSQAKRGCLQDLRGLPAEDLGPAKAVAECLSWLCRAQDSSASHDGGVARHFSLISGWAPSYPETTGYILPTMIACSEFFNDESSKERARGMLDWLVGIQLADGAFQGGVVGGAQVAVPVTFNTGQILMGLASGARAWGKEYLIPMRKAADWLVATQDSDGCWRRFPTPFAGPGEKVYETHVGWGLLEAARIEAGRGYAEAALRNVSWALTMQMENGWFRSCCLADPSQPLTHTIGYVLRGILEAYRSSGDSHLLDASRKTADGLLKAFRIQNGFLPGRIGPDWRGTVSWSCLTGTAQVSLCWLMLYSYTKDARYREAAFAANRFVRRTIRTDGPPEIRGGVKGSFPVYGDYGTYQYLNWACKFVIDANLMEISIREKERLPTGTSEGTA